MAGEHDTGLLKWSKWLYYGFALFILYTFTANHLPDTGAKVPVFVFAYFMNVGALWLAHQMLRMMNYHAVLRWVLFPVQLAMMVWTMYEYRFVINHTWKLYVPGVFVQVPIDQYKVIFPLMVLCAFYKIWDKR